MPTTLLLRLAPSPSFIPHVCLFYVIKFYVFLTCWVDWEDKAGVQEKKDLEKKRPNTLNWSGSSELSGTIYFKNVFWSSCIFCIFPLCLCLPLQCRANARCLLIVVTLLPSVGQRKITKDWKSCNSKCD